MTESNNKLRLKLFITGKVFWTPITIRGFDFLFLGNKLGGYEFITVPSFLIGGLFLLIALFYKEENNDEPLDYDMTNK